MRAIFFDEDDAAAVVRRLTTGGYEAHVDRERFQGEDDDEDHPWAVLSDAPAFVLEILVDEFDGWLDHEEHPSGSGSASGAAPLRLPPATAPLDLPSAPRRVKRPDLLDQLDV